MVGFLMNYAFICCVFFVYLAMGQIVKKNKKKLSYIFNKIQDEITSEALMKMFKYSEKDFTRKKKLSFSITLMMISNLIKKSLSLEIVNFVKIFNGYSSTELSNFTQSAFIQSRNKINPEVFKHLSATLITEYYSDNELSIKRWNGFRVLAVDGSRINLPDTKELETVYGRTKNQTKSGLIQARTSILYDVLNHLVIDSELATLDIGEIPLAKQHLLKAVKNDLIIYDRGYPSFELVYLHYEREVDFLFRVKKNFNNVVKAFMSSGKKSEIVEISPGKGKVKESNIFTKKSTVKVRLLSVTLDDGSIEILMTSLLDSDIYKNNIFKKLYFKRWGIETYYDELKNKLKVEYFSGYSNNTILQDFNVAIFISNIQSLIVNELEEEINLKTKGCKLKYKVNSNLSYGFLKDRIIALFLGNEDIENELKKLFKEHLIPIRPNRKNKRKTGRYIARTKPKTYTNRKDSI